MANLLTASILHNDSDTERITIACRLDSDGMYRWYCPTRDGEGMESTEVSASTLDGAKTAAQNSWGSQGSTWDFQPDWN